MGFLIQRPKVEDTVGPRLDDRKITDSAYGIGIQKGFGTTRVAGNIIHGNELTEQTNVERIDTGGKGGKSPRPTNTTYSYYATFALSLGEGIVDAVLRLWFDGTLVYDAKNQTVSRPVQFTLYKGTEDQDPDPTLQALNADTPGYRGQAYLVFEDLDLSEVGNKIPNITAEVIYATVGSSTISVSSINMEGVAYTGDFMAENSLCVDWYRDVGYMQTSAGVTIAVRLSDMTFLRSFSSGTGKLRGVSLIDGTLIYSDTSFGGENSRVDQYTGNVITTSTNNTALTQMHGPTVSIFQIGSLGVNEIFIARQVNGTATQLNAYDGVTMDYIDTIISFGATYNHMKHVSGYPGTGVGYALFNTSSSILVYQITIGTTVDEDGAGYTLSATPELIATLTTSDIDSSWAGFDTVAVASFDESSDGTNVLFDLTDGTIVSAVGDSGGGEIKAFKYDPISNSVIWVSEDLTVGWQSEGNQVTGQDLVNGNYYGWTTSLQNSNDQNFTMIDLRNGAIDNYFDGSNQGVNMGWPDQIWDGDRMATFQIRGSTTRDEFARSFYGIRASQGANVADIISYYCEQSGLVPAQYDVTAVSDTVDGFLVTDSSSGADNLKELLELLHIDVVESDGVLTFVPRADTVDWTIDQADFVRPKKRGGNLYEEPRVRERDIPVRIEITAKSEARDYEDSTQRAARSTYPNTTVRSKKKEEKDLPAVITDDDIRRMAEKRLYTYWVERDRLKFNLSKKYIGMEPTDVANITLNDGSDRNFRITDLVIGKDLSLSIEARRQISGQYDSTILSDAGQTPLRSARTKGITPELFILNTTLLRDEDAVDNTGLRSYWAAGYYGNLTFGGAALFKSQDAVAWEEVGVTANEVTWGVVETALGVPDSPWRWDYTNTFTVRLVTGSIASDTETNVLSGSNGAILLQSNGDVEIIQFMTATAGSETDQYILSNLLRGRRGTDTMMGNHAIGDKIVFLTPSTIRSMRLDLARLNQTNFYKGMTQGMLFEEAMIKIASISGRDQTPYAPRNARAEFNGSDIDLTWVRRGRVSGELIDGTDTVPLSETLEQYEIDIYDDAGTTILRTVVVNDAQTTTYTAAEQSTDSWDGSSHIKVAIYQMSGIVGRGFGELVTLEIN